MFTLAAVLTTFGAVSFLGGSGAMAILVFGIILGNSHDFSKFLKIKNTSLVNSTIKFFHGEMTFFIRTFFFVYIGMMVSFSWIDLDFVLCSLALLLIIVVVRYMSVGVTVALYPEKKNDRGLMMSMLPRGLASAVLATLPASADIRGSEYFTDLTFAIIIFTNLIMTVGVFVAGKKEPTKGGH
jgi:cell volume regulation protein A